MKKDQSPQEILHTQFMYITDAYDRTPNKSKGVIQLVLKHFDKTLECFLHADGLKMEFQFGRNKNPSCTLTASFYDWLELSADRLNPVWGAITGRLNFKGSTSIFKELIHKKILFDINFDSEYDPLSKYEVDKNRRFTPKKILVINGSPRGRNGYTYYYLNKFIEGVKKTETNYEIIDIHKYNIKPCIGCFSCWKKIEGDCVQKDDVSELYSKVDNADIIVYAFPLYVDGVPGILKNFIDRGLYRLYPYMTEGSGITRHPRRVRRDQQMTVFSVCGFPEYKHFQSIRQYFKQVSHNTHIPITNEIYRTACMYLYITPAEYKKINKINKYLTIAGMEIGRTGLISTSVKKQIETGVNRKDFQKQSTKFWDNVINKKPTEVMKV